MTADPPFCHTCSLTGEGDFRDFLGGECDGERLLLFSGDRDLCLLSFEGDDDEFVLCLLSFEGEDDEFVLCLLSFEGEDDEFVLCLLSSPLSFLVVGDLDRDCL